MVEKKPKFHGYKPSADAIRECIKRLESMSTRDWRLSMVRYYPERYATVSDVPEPEQAVAFTEMFVGPKDDLASYDYIEGVFAVMIRGDWDELRLTIDCTLLLDGDQGPSRPRVQIWVAPGFQFTEIIASYPGDVGYVESLLEPFRRENKTQEEDRQAIALHAREASVVPPRRSFWGKVGRVLQVFFTNRIVEGILILVGGALIGKYFL